MSFTIHYNIIVNDISYYPLIKKQRKAMRLTGNAAGKVSADRTTCGGLDKTPIMKLAEEKKCLSL